MENQIERLKLYIAINYERLNREDLSERVVNVIKNRINRYEEEICNLRDEIDWNHDNNDADKAWEAELNQQNQN